MSNLLHAALAEWGRVYQAPERFKSTAKTHKNAGNKKKIKMDPRPSQLPQLYHIFRCDHASLLEVVSVCPSSVRPSIRPSIRPLVGWSRVIFERRKSRFLRLERLQMTNNNNNNDDDDDNDKWESTKRSHLMYPRGTCSFFFLSAIHSSFLSHFLSFYITLSFFLSIIRERI